MPGRSRRGSIGTPSPGERAAEFVAEDSPASGPVLVLAAERAAASEVAPAGLPGPCSA